MKNYLNKVKGFLKSPTGKATETALWQVFNLIVGILVIYIAEANIVLLLPVVPALNALTKYINLKYIKN